MIVRPRRSLLFLPGSNLRALEKARGLPADGIIFDLEDAVAPAAKALARDQVIAALVQDSRGYGRRERIVRINDLDSQWGQLDAAAVAGATHAVDAVLLPKIERTQQIRLAAEIFSGTAAGQLPIWIMLETPRGVLNALEIIDAGKNHGLAVVVMGTSDLSKEARIPPTADRSGLLPALSHCVLAARASGLDILDGVHLQLDDPKGLQAACRQGHALGFDGKTLIHPNQIEAANRYFSPTRAVIDQAQEIVAAWQHAKTSGTGVCVVGGRLVEQLHIAEAERLLALAAAIAAAAH